MSDTHNGKRRTVGDLRQLSDDKRLKKRRNRSGVVRAVPHRVKSEHADWPASVQPPRPPAIAVLFPVTDFGEAPEAVYGQYPTGFLKRVLPRLGCQRHEILHVCSGSLPPGEGIRVDLRRAARPDVLADGTALPFRDASFKAIMLDPPYTEHYAAELYGIPYPRPAALLREAARVVRHGGVIGIVHYFQPKPPPGCTFDSCFAMSTGFDMPLRAVTFYRRLQADLPGLA